MDTQKNENNIQVYPKRKYGMYIIIGLTILILSFSGAFLVGRTLLGSPGEMSQGERIGPFFDSAEFTVNIAETSGRRYLMVQFSAEVENKEVLEELQNKLPVFQDKVIMVLSSQTIEDLNSSDGKAKIKQMLMENINEILTKGKVLNIFFNKFVYQ